MISNCNAEDAVACRHRRMRLLETLPISSLDNLPMGMKQSWASLRVKSDHSHPLLGELAHTLPWDTFLDDSHHTANSSDALARKAHCTAVIVITLVLKSEICYMHQGIYVLD